MCRYLGMPSRSKTRPRDPNQLAYQVMLESTGQSPKTEPPAAKDPAAVSLGRRGGLARAAAMPAKKRTQIAAKAAKARWNGKP
jgi:hypothetical protein